jgi:hypothetical protein
MRLNERVISLSHRFESLADSALENFVRHRLTFGFQLVVFMGPLVNFRLGSIIGRLDARKLARLLGSANGCDAAVAPEMGSAAPRQETAANRSIKAASTWKFTHRAYL